jgi:hypothetical protein
MHHTENMLKKDAQKRCSVPILCDPLAWERLLPLHRILDVLVVRRHYVLHLDWGLG